MFIVKCLCLSNLSPVKRIRWGCFSYTTLYHSFFLLLYYGLFLEENRCHPHFRVDICRINRSMSKNLTLAKWSTAIIEIYTLDRIQRLCAPLCISLSIFNIFSFFQRILIALFVGYTCMQVLLIFASSWTCPTEKTQAGRQLSPPPEKYPNYNLNWSEVEEKLSFCLCLSAPCVLLNVKEG